MPNARFKSTFSCLLVFTVNLLDLHEDDSERREDEA